MPAGVVIATEHLTRRFGDRTAVDHLNLEVRAGETFGFLGPNGAGKTTTIRMLLGLMEPSSGLILVNGSRIRRGHADLTDIGAMVERPGLYPHLTAAENLAVFGRMSGRRLKDGESGSALEAAGLDPANRGAVRNYSTGMRQRLALALALIGRPRIIILDEPTDGLDPVGIADVRNAIKSLADQGVTIFLSSHLLAEVERVCSRVGILVMGRLVRDASLEEIRTETKQWVLSFADEETAVRAVQQLSTRGLAAAAGPDGREVVVRAPNTPESSVLSALAAVGLVPTEVSLRNQTLEELFLDLVQHPTHSDA